MLKFKRKGVDVAVETNENVYSIKYPCEKSYECSSLESIFPAGYYKIELYGASGGHLDGFISTYRNPAGDTCSDENVTKYKGNTKCTYVTSMAGAGGYTSAYLFLRKPTKIFLAIGGQGTHTYGSSDDGYEDSVRPKGGFNGGAKGSLFSKSTGSSGGGGATDFRLYEDDFWHRVLVSGGGAGSDNENSGDDPTVDNGRGGAGGGLIAQGPWIENVYESSHVATQEKGFTFGNGEAPQKCGSKSPEGIKFSSGYNDRAGAGGGWFGGFASHHGNGGAGGGSSFAFTPNTIVPEGDIESRDEYYENPVSKPYAIKHKSSFRIMNPIFVPGIWDGNGFARITVLTYYRYSKPIRFCIFGFLSSVINLIYS